MLAYGNIRVVAWGPPQRLRLALAEGGRDFFEARGDGGMSSRQVCGQGSLKRL